MNNKNDLPVINFYVEKIEKRTKTLLLDFIFESEYTSFIDTLQNQHNFEFNFETLNQYFIKPSMILVKNFSSSKSLYEGAVFSMYESIFFQMMNEETIRVKNMDYSIEPSQILLTIEDGNEFAKAIEESETKSVSKNSSFDDKTYLDMFGRIYDPNIDEGNNTFSASEIEFLSSFNKNNSKMIVWNVEQGNANGIYDDNSIMLFDFGAPIQVTAKRTLQLYNSIVSFLQNKSYALIISHWDLDHYKMLCQAPDDFFQKIKFIIFPTRAVSRTSKQVLQRFSNICKAKCIPVLPTSPKNGNFNLVIWEEPFHLYVGNAKMNINNSGLFLLVSSSASYGLFTGDRTNWNPNSKPTLYWPCTSQMNIVVPHHGGNSKTIPDSHVITNPNIAAISVGSNTYSHPTSQTLNQYKARGYKIERTDCCGDIIIPL